MERADNQIEWYYLFGRRVPALSVLLVISLINGLGLLVLFSIGRADSSGASSYFFKQSVWMVFAFSAFLLALFIDFERQSKWILPLAGLSVLLLALVLIPGIGIKVNGARRWLPMGLMNMQVSDVAKVGYIFLLASYFSSVQRSEWNWLKSFIIPGLIIGLFFGLLILQPDFGTAFLFAIVGGALFFLSGIRLKLLIPTVIAGITAFATMIMLDPVRLQRILSFLDVEANRSGGAYQLWQGIIGFGVGGVSGVGLGNGRQQFAFLPEAHTDFIFPIIGEELGLIATLAVVGLFLLLFFIVWNQMHKAPNLFQLLLVSGALFFISFQALINMGVATGCLPTKGMSLPFVSYGGSNLVASYFLLGIIVRAIWCWNAPPEYNPREIEF